MFLLGYTNARTKKAEYQKAGNKNWEDKNKNYSNYLKQRSASKSFIKNKSTITDIEEFEGLLKERKAELIK